MFTHILVPTDFSATADAALSYARHFAAQSGATVHLLHVIEDPAVAMPFAGPLDTGVLSLQALFDSADERLSQRIRPRERGVPRMTGDVVFGSPAQRIVGHAMSKGISLIVMGTAGRTGLAHAFSGSVAEHVVRCAPCPVLTVHSPAVPAGERLEPLALKEADHASH